MAESRDPYSVPLDEFIDKVQPHRVMSRRSGEHWLGALYARKVSPRISRFLIRANVSAMATTYTMIAIGTLGAAVIAMPGVWSAVVAALAMQTYLVLDCCDGEIARWNGTEGAKGVYIDRAGHYLTEATAFVALGFRAQNALEIGDWAYLGSVVALLAIFAKSESDLVGTSRASSGMSPIEDVEPTTATGLRSLRSRVLSTGIHRILGAIELTMLVIVAALIDTAFGSLAATRVLLVVTAVVAVTVVIGHFISIVTSDRLTRNR
ncbi:MAG: CDP-alcohol phosphatidyltransferase family protein [Actinomycetota bacterium]|nr:CDP-alcohol phosphatidyltransferase family protein [Actinomycetota bacterium]